MKNHTKIYLSFMLNEGGLDPHECVCEVCSKGGGSALNLDINHIEPRQSGGTKREENINNLMAMCRDCHLNFADKKHLKESLILIHRQFMKTFTAMFKYKPTEEELLEL